MDLKRLIASVVLVSCFLFSNDGYAGIPIPVYIISGQSNAECPSLLDDVDETSVNFEAITNVTIFTLKTLDGAPLEPGVNNCRALKGRFGPELSLASRLGENYSHSAIIKLAIGGTGVYQLEGYEDWNVKSEELALDLVNLINDSLNKLIEAGYDPYIQRWLIVNGEADSRINRRAISYKTNMKDLIAYVRNSINQLMFPVSMVRLTRIDLSEKNFPEVLVVRNAIEELAIEDPSIHIIDADPYPKDQTEIHYAAPGSLSTGTQVYLIDPIFSTRYRYVITP